MLSGRWVNFNEWIMVIKTEIIFPPRRPRDHLHRIIRGLWAQRKEFILSHLTGEEGSRKHGAPVDPTIRIIHGQVVKRPLKSSQWGTEINSSLAARRSNGQWSTDHQQIWICLFIWFDFIFNFFEIILFDFSYNFLKIYLKIFYSIFYNFLKNLFEIIWFDFHWTNLSVVVFYKKFHSESNMQICEPI